MKKDNKINIPLIAALIPILPFYGYLSAYSYETSYLGIFGIPSYLVQVTTNTIILNTIYLLVIAVITIVFSSISIFSNKKIQNRFLLPTILDYIMIIAILLSVSFLLFPEIVALTPTRIKI